MFCFLLNFLAFFGFGLCLWNKGIVHYAMNSKDYDIHSQDIISEVIQDVQRELCIKFFNSPPDFTATVENKILYINNPDKRKNCPPDSYNYTGSVVDMIVGYKCLNRKDVTRIIVDMLRASIDQSPTININSYDLVRKFQEHAAMDSSTMLTPADRNYINAHYHTECSALGPQPARRLAAPEEAEVANMSPENELYYRDKTWPLGIVMYGFEKILQNSQQASDLRRAMSIIELDSCIVFQEVEDDEILKARSLLWFAISGAETPQLGFVEGNQTISLEPMTVGALGHSAHILNNLMRAVGVPMQSNRHDRDYYVLVNWNNVQKGKEHYLEKTPIAASIRESPFGYDYDSVTHAPANYMCKEAACGQGEATVLPAQDHLWQRTMSMGHRLELSETDREILRVIYNQPCRDRYAAHNT